MGVGTDDHLQAFYANDVKTHGKAREHWGFSTNNLDGERGERKEKYDVRVIDFANWVQQVVMQRELPQDSASAWGKPKVVVKMDIEGSELIVVPKMLTRGVLCALDVFFGEWHRGYGDADAELLHRINLLANTTGCTTFLELDDEHYLHDGKLYPTLPPT
eukprot:1529641-Amphidinium_carterae.1